MKKFLKILLILLLIFSGLFLLNALRNYIIFNQIQNRGEEVFNSSNYNLTIETSSGTSYAKTDIYFKNGIMKIYNYSNSNTQNKEIPLESIDWINFSDLEDLSYNILPAPSKKEFSNEMLNLTKQNMYYMYDKPLPLYTYFFRIIRSVDRAYVIKLNSMITNYYNIDTKDPIRSQMIYVEETKYTLKLNTVTDEDISKPEYNF